MIFKLTLFKNKKRCEFWIEHYELIKFLANLNSSEEFQLGEVFLLPSEVTSFHAKKYYLSKVTNIKKEEVIQ